MKPVSNICGRLKKVEVDFGLPLKLEVCYNVIPGASRFAGTRMSVYNGYDYFPSGPTTLQEFRTPNFSERSETRKSNLRGFGADKSFSLSLN